MPDGASPLLEFRDLSKSYPGVQALDGVSFAVSHGEVHALLGANGAGKSTLIKILAGAVSRDAGEVLIEGRPIEAASPLEASEAGIACLYQEPALVPTLTVEQNIFLGHEIAGPFGRIDHMAQRKRVRELLAEIAPKLSPGRVVSTLRTSERQLVALAKALRGKARLLIMDEPSASMTDAEISALFAVIESLKKIGTSILYITHRLEEVYRIADRVTVLRDGLHVMTRPVSEVPRGELVTMIAGRELRAAERIASAGAGKPLLRVEGLSKAGQFSDISFEVRAGEVVALAGLVGAGRTEIARAVLHADASDGGRITFPRVGVKVASPAEAVEAGVAMIPEDRKGQGIVPRLSVADNLILSAVRSYGTKAFGYISRERIRTVVARNVWRFNIQPRGAEDRPIETLSGGNQQKVLLARAIESGAEILILDEPTAGVDVGAKSEIHLLIRDLVQVGKGVLLISSETEEVLALADRILIIREGRLVRELDGRAATSHDLAWSLLGEHRV
jgi:ABC-type sugar transport system ATPase subunit